MAKSRSRAPIALLVLVAAMLLSALAGAYAGSVVNGSSTDGTPGYIASSAWGAGSTADGFPADDNGGCARCPGNNGSAPTSIAINSPGVSPGGTPTDVPGVQG